MLNKNNVFIIFADLAVLVAMILFIGLFTINKNRQKQEKVGMLSATIKPVAKLTKIVNKATGEVNYIDFHSFGQFVGENTDKPFGEMLESYLFLRDFKMQGKRDMF